MDSPYWCSKSLSLYFVDLFGKNIYRYSYKHNKVYQSEIKGQVQPSFCIPVKKSYNQFLIGLNRSVVLCEWDGYSSYTKIIRVLCSVEDGTTNHLNQAVAGPNGVWSIIELFFFFNRENICNMLTNV